MMVGLAEQRQTQISGAALKRKSDAAARAKICKASHPKNAEKAYACLTKSRVSFKNAATAHLIPSV